jgi:CxxC-x17-CxxC domain-containing protein
MGRGRPYGNGRDFAPRSRFDDRSRDNKEMFSAVCANCGKECKVPFRPSSGKPVYCSDCYEKMGGKSERRSFSGPRDNRGPVAVDYSAQLTELNNKMDKILKLLQPKESTE